MNTNIKIGETLFPCFLKLDVFRFIDALIHTSLKETILDGWVHCLQKYNLRIHGWIVLSGGVKLIISSDDPALAIEDVVDCFMSYTDKKLIQKISQFKNETKRKWMLQLFENNRRNQRLLFWHSRYTLEKIETTDRFLDYLNDIHEGPVRNGMVWDAQQYMYSSAIDYFQKEQGLLPVVRLDHEDVFSKY